MLPRSPVTEVGEEGRPEDRPEYGISVVQPRQYQRDDKSLERSRLHRVSDRTQLPENRKASEDRPLHMRSHHKVYIDEDTQVTNGLNWVDRGPVDEQWRPGQLMLSSCCHSPQNLSFVRIKLKSLRLHVGEGSEPNGKDIDLGRRARTTELCVIGV